MGFSCYLCREPFVEKGYMLNKGGGDGHDEKPVSATKCGHLFHTDCLKNAFQAQGSTTAWATKLCPVCKQTLQATDILRVHASPFESPAVEAQRNEANEIRKFNQKLKQENEGLLKRLEILYLQIREIQSDAANLRREKQDLSHVLDQVRRINSMNVSETESLRREVEKLKNIIVTLTEKLTTSHFGQETNNTGAGHYIRNDFADQQQQQPFAGRGFELLPVNMNNISLCNGAPMKIGTPPGFPFPRAVSSDNGAECQSSQESHARLSISPDDEASCVGVIGSGGPPRMCSYNNYYGLEEPVINQLDLDNNLEEMSKHLLRLTASTTSTSNESCKGQVGNGLSFASVSGTRKATGDDASAISSFIGSHTDGNGEYGNQELKDEPNASGKITNANFISNYNSEEDDDADSDNSGKWLEKKSRRRTHSKSDRIKLDMPSDKKLYGSFLCPTCKARWGSSQSVLNKAQTCRYCKTEVHPYNQGPILSRKQLEVYKQDSAGSSKKEHGQNN